MTKQKLLFRLFALVACMSCAIGADAYDFEVNGIYYNITGDRTVEVTSNPGEYSGNVTIPSMISNAGTDYQVTAIGQQAFSYCRDLTSVSIPETVTDIKIIAFSGCTGLTSVTIPNSVTNIGDHAFSSCTGLTSVTIPNSVTSIGIQAFYNCTGLTSVIISNSLTEIPKCIFQGCDHLESVSIPNSVLSIGVAAFSGCSSLTSVTIPNSVTTIENSAFFRCSGLRSVVIGNGVTTIGNGVFSYCNALRSVTCLATTPPTINGSFDSDTYSTASLYVPQGGKDAYQGANYWKNFININELVYDFEVNGIYYTITGDRTVSVARNPYMYSGNINIPAMTSYGGTVYQVTSIANDAFRNCIGMTSLTIPASVTSIEGTTSGCDGLTSITVASGNSVYDSRNNCNAIIETASNTLVAGCKTTVIPNTVTTIGDFAFYSISSLTSVTIPNSVTSIGDYAFACCSSMTSVTISNSVSTIGRSTFYGCSALTSVTIPNSVATIGDFAFEGCTGLINVTIGSGVTTIGIYAFNQCSALRNVTSLATTPPAIAVSTGPFSSSTFDDDTYSAATLYVPAASKDAYQAADGWKNFTNIRAVPYDFMVNGICYKITGTNTVEVCENPAPYSGNVYIPSTVTYDGKTYQVTGIRTYAFYDCDGLTGVTIPNSVTTIGDAAFSGCDNLTTVTIPNSVTRIGWYAFAYCNGLTSVTIGSGVTTIDDNAFAACPALTSVTCLATTPPTLGGDVFYSDTYENATLKVPAASLNAYKTANGWRNFLHIIANKRGDINGDGHVDVSDVTMLISAVLGNTTVDMNVGDLNGDNHIDVADVTAIISIILNQ